MTDYKVSALTTGTPVSADLFPFVKVADNSTPPAGAGGSDQKVTASALAAVMAVLAGSLTGINAANYGVVGDGTTDNTTTLQNAVNAALATQAGTAVVDLPPGSILVNGTIACSSATVSAAGNGVLFRGHGAGSQIVKGSGSGPVVYWQGYDATNFPTAFGGAVDVTFEGNGSTTGLVKVVDGQQMFWRGCRFNGTVGLALELDAVQDSYWSQCTMNNVGSTTAPPVSIYGNSTGTSNMLWFSQCRIETFLDGAVWIKAGSGNTGGNNGFFFSQCKFETTTLHGDIIVADGNTQQLSISQCFFALDAYAGGYSTPANCVSFGGSTAVGGNQLTLEDCWIHAASGLLNSVVDINGASGAMTGPVVLSSIFSDQTVTTAVAIVNGCSGVYLSVRGIAVDGALFSGDGSYYNASGNNYLEIIGSSFGFLNFASLGFVPAMPLFNRLGSGVTLSGATTSTGAIVFGAQSAAEAGNGVGASAFIVLDNDKVYTLKNELDDGSGNVTVAGTVTVGSGITDAEQFACLSSSYTLTNSTSAQKLFNATTNGTFTAAASTSYFFECLLDVTGLSSSTHTIDFGLAGTATFTSVMYEALTSTSSGGAASLFAVTSASATAVTASGTGTVLLARIKGVMRVNAAGTVIPQITQATASAAAVVAANSYFRAWPVGSNTVATVGSWT